jgi:tRNA threonylcarbamoyladenosine biosynthesis protein TsaB
MKILGIDTATQFLSLGIYNNSKIYGYHLEVGKRLSVLLTLTIKRTLEAAGIKLRDIDYFACGLGPGSFTGMRTGLAAIKGLSFALRKPVIGISTLDILAKNALPCDRPIVAIEDARRNLLYCGFFKNKDGILERTKPYGLLDEKGLLKNISPGSIILGDALPIYREKLMRKVRGATFLDKDAWYPKAHHLIALALERIQSKRSDNAFDIKPIYLYPKECQIKKSSKFKEKKNL